MELLQSVLEPVDQKVMLHLLNAPLFYFLLPSQEDLGLPLVQLDH